jgi:hypothetical protein
MDPVLVPAAFVAMVMPSFVNMSSMFAVNASVKWPTTSVRCTYVLEKSWWNVVDLAVLTCGSFFQDSRSTVNPWEWWMIHASILVVCIENEEKLMWW